jgi:hypothetical protein
MESGPDFEQRSHAAVNIGEAFGGMGDARKNFEERALARSIAPEYADDLTVSNLE